VSLWLQHRPIIQNTPCSLYLLRCTFSSSFLYNHICAFSSTITIELFESCGVCSKVEQLLELSGSVLGGLDAVADGTRVLVNLVVVTTLVCLVTEEVDRCVLGSVLLLGLDVLQAVCLVPTSGENVE
jgi:hypothetical protein